MKIDKKIKGIFLKRLVMLVELTEFSGIDFYEDQSHDEYSLDATNDYQFSFSLNRGRSSYSIELNDNIRLLDIFKKKSVVYAFELKNYDLPKLLKKAMVTVYSYFDSNMEMVNCVLFDEWFNAEKL
jgi:hypothetical protein